MIRLLFLLALLCSPVVVFASNSRQIIVPATLTFQGKSVLAYMAIDTGATTTTIDTRLADRLGVPLQVVTGYAQMADGRPVAYRATLMDVAVATMTRKGSAVNIMDYSGSREGIDGILGMNFIDGMTMTIDWKHHRIYWSE